MLKRPAIGVSDNFFQVGGDSIRLIQMQVMAREAGLAFTLRDVFNHQSIRELARLLAAPARLGASSASANTPAMTWACRWPPSACMPGR